MTIDPAALRSGTRKNLFFISYMSFFALLVGVGSATAGVESNIPGVPASSPQFIAMFAAWVVIVISGYFNPVSMSAYMMFNQIFGTLRLYQVIEMLKVSGLVWLVVV